MSSKKPTQRSAIADVVAREYTIHMHKRVCRLDYPKRIIEKQKKRRERREKKAKEIIQDFVYKEMLTVYV